jgi:hypothetical protein
MKIDCDGVDVTNASASGCRLVDSVATAVDCTYPLSTELNELIDAVDNTNGGDALVCHASLPTN